MCMSVYALIKVVGYYDLSDLSMSVMGFHKKNWMDVSSIQFFLYFRNFFNFATSLIGSVFFRIRVVEKRGVRTPWTPPLWIRRCNITI